MFRIEKISALELPELTPYRTMRRSAEHEAQGIFIAEGEKVTRRLLESRFTVVSVVLPEKWLEVFRPLLAARSEDFTVYLAEKELLESITGFSLFQGVLAVGKIPQIGSLDTILQKSSIPKLLVAVDELANAENLGALMRNCVAFGVQMLLVGETCSSPYLRRSVRNSMGTVFQLPIWEVKMANEAVRVRRDDPPKFSLAQTYGRVESAASPPIHIRVAKFFRRRISPAIAVSSSAAKGMAFPKRFSKRAMNGWRFRWRTAWIRSTSAQRWRVFLYEANRQRKKA